MSTPCEQSAQLQETVGVGSAELLHRVKVMNLPMHESASIKKFFQTLGVERFRKAPNWKYAFLTFEKTLSTEYSTVSKEIYRARFQEKKSSGGGPETLGDKCFSEDTRSPSEQLADQVTPMHKIPYTDQLARKHKKGIKHLAKLKRQMTRIPELSDVGRQQIAWAFQEGLPFEISDIIPSPDINQYRSKCDFTIGKDPEGQPTVGFLLGLYRHGITSVLSPADCIHIPDRAKRIAKEMEDYIRASEYPVYDRCEKTGVWRSLMVKAQRTGDVMILIQLNTSALTEEELAKEKQKLIEYWTLKENPTTLLLQIWNGESNGITDKAQTEVLTGDGYVYEELLGCRFRISSSAFFQVNTPATELLYSKCAEWCNIDKKKKTTLLDLCCGTGTIGITMARTVDRVIGIEMIEDAIVDAKANAEINHIANVQYHASKVEERIDVVVNEKNEEVVAVLDPPRHIRKVIFISCDASQAMHNFISLCRPTSNRFKGLPFKPTRAVSIDLFPHTDHCELMVEFERIE
ncbi:S-adenosyl-L-methionine-dependent methyltransferase [Dichotomocladium elegans]|nr:S-adenosyl-L-methionine-dependent methyltransferase [Dichotomocladium elegans]